MTSPSKAKIALSPTESTLLITLYGRYLDSKSSSPILNDTFAGSIVSNIDYDFSRLGVGSTSAGIAAVRATLFDRWVLNFLSNHPNGATVINVACGLDTRALRLVDQYAGKMIRWIDIDLPDVVKLREKLVTSPPSEVEGKGAVDYTLLAGSAFDLEFMTSLPNDRPTVVVMEGLSAYFTVEEVQVLLSTLCGHFKRGELVFDSVNWFAIFTSRFFGYSRQSGAPLRLELDDPKALENAHPGLKLLEVRQPCTEPEVAKLSLVARFFMWVSSWFEGTKELMQFLRFEF